MVSNIGTSIRWPIPVRARANNAVDRRHRNEARLAGGALHQHRNT
jgi:hypothetical protein